MAARVTKGTRAPPLRPLTATRAAGRDVAKRTEPVKTPRRSGARGELVSDITLEIDTTAETAARQHHTAANIPARAATSKGRRGAPDQSDGARSKPSRDAPAPERRTTTATKQRPMSAKDRLDPSVRDRVDGEKVDRDAGAKAYPGISKGRRTDRAFRDPAQDPPARAESSKERLEQASKPRRPQREPQIPTIPLKDKRSTPEIAARPSTAKGQRAGAEVGTRPLRPMSAKNKRDGDAPGRGGLTARPASQKDERGDIAARPSTTRGTRAAGPYIERKRAISRRDDEDAPFDPSHDYLADCARLRSEMEKEFGDKPVEVHLEWLDELEQMNRALTDNVVQMTAANDSPIIAFNTAADTAIAEVQEGEGILGAGMNMIDRGFDAIDEILAEQARMLDQRDGILEKMRMGLLEHQNDYNADLEPDDYDTLGYEPERETEPSPRVTDTRARPMTAGPRSRRT